MKQFLCLVAFLVGCGGDGVSDSKKLTDLSASESKDVCLELAADYAPRTVNCDGQMITIGIDEADCNTTETAPATCTATVGDARACYDAMYSMTDAQLCMGTAPPAACAKLEGC